MMTSRALPLATEQAFDLLEARDIATLYEMWAYFAVVLELEKQFGRPTSAVRTEVGVMGAQLKYGFEVRWANHRASYNETFKSQGVEKRSYSLRMRPDVTLWLPDGTCHVLDAKFKLVREKDVSKYKSDDIHKMHAYRDAIESVRSAWVMYPGTEPEEFLVAPGSMHGVGAVPVRPDGDEHAPLAKLLTRLRLHDLPDR